MTHRSRLPIVLLLVAGLLVTIVGLPSASAQTSEDAATQAAHVADQLEALRIEASQLDEEYHVALMDLEAAQGAVLDAEIRVSELEAEYAAIQSTAAEYAVQAYINGGSLQNAEAFFESDQANDVPTRIAYLAVAAGDSYDVIDALRATRLELDDEQAELSRAEEHQADLVAAAEAARSGSLAAIAEEEELLASLEAEVVTLLAAEEAARAAEIQRRAEEAARAAAAAASQPPPPAAPAPAEAAPAPTQSVSNAAPSTPTTTPTTVPVDSEPVPTVPPVVGVPPTGAEGAVALAWTLIGIPYVWAGSTPATGFDCSGFTSYVWGQMGYSLPHSAAAQYDMSIHISVSELQPGDLVFYGWGYIHHVAIYVGGGQIIHAPGAGRSVRVDSIYYWDQLLGTGRLP